MTLELAATFPVGPLQCNCAILADPESREALVVDPGDEADRILRFLAQNRLTAVGLVHTHAHFDHVGVSARLARETGAPILLHEADAPLYSALEDQAAFFGLGVEAPAPLARFLSDGERVGCGRGGIEVIHTPGHTPGSLCFRVGGQRELLLSGDTLFRRSIGRTDLWGGSLPSIVASIRERLFKLPGDVRVLPGHGEATTVAEEARLNPFVGSRAAPLV